MIINNPEKLKDFIIKLLEDKNAQNINVLEITQEDPLAKYMIFASGRSQKNILAIAKHILYELKHTAKWPVIADGINKSDWILIDAGDLIINIFHPEEREKFKLEELWKEKDPLNKSILDTD